MQYPDMSKQPHRAVKVPALDGGVNYTDMPYAVQDNQLTECKNMWWHNGALRTRPGLEYKERTLEGFDIIGADGTPMTFNLAQPLSEWETVLINLDDNMDGTFEFYAAVYTGDGTFKKLGTNGYGFLVPLTLSADETGRLTVLIVRDEEKYSAFFSNGEVYLCGYLENTGLWVAANVRENCPYAPLIMLNGKGTRDESGEPATSYEGRNRLTGAFRCQFNTDGKSSEFYLPQTALTHYAGETIHVSLWVQNQDDKSDIYEMEFNLPPISEESEVTYTYDKKGIDARYLGMRYDTTGAVSIDYCELICMLDYKTGLLSFTCNQKTTDGNLLYSKDAPLPQVIGMETNNLEVTAWSTDMDTQRTVTAMTAATWFGGNRSGVEGGSRLFVAGNPSDKALVCWSDLNNPLYFPENNFAYVGDPSQAVTGFGKQEDRLIIFKEREIYSVEYVAGNYTQEDLAAGRVVDVTAVSATFPVTPVHSTVGCDCPGTIRLVNNKLVWLCSNGHVYTLTSINQYSETNVRDISLLVQRELQKHTVEELKAAVAGEYMGYYLLAVGNRIYMMNAECGAFASVSYYSSKERAQRAIPWYVWELDTTWKVLGIVSNGESLSIECTGGHIVVNGADDNGEPIPCSFTTKAFDFGQDDKRKAVTQLYLGATAASPLKMRLSYITDRFTAEDAAILEGEGDPENMTAETYKVYRVTPNVHRVGLFGLRVDCDGAMAVTGLTIKYKNEGVTR